MVSAVLSSGPLSCQRDAEHRRLGLSCKHSATCTVVVSYGLSCDIRAICSE